MTSNLCCAVVALISLRCLLLRLMRSGDSAIVLSDDHQRPFQDLPHRLTGTIILNRAPQMKARHDHDSRDQDQNRSDIELSVSTYMLRLGNKLFIPTLAVRLLE